MSKSNELKLYQREHFEEKIDKLLEPEIEREELKLKTTINKILDKGVDKFSKSIGADKVIARLKKAEEEKRVASRQAYMFFNAKASSIVSYNKAKEYKFDRDDKEINKCFNEVTLDICEGQALDKEFENLDNVTEDLYLEMIKKKTGSLIAAAAMLPSIYAEDEIDNTELFRTFGESLGKGFQIHDDLLEITSDSKTMGKSLDSDIFEGKQTIMVIKAKHYFKESWDSIVLNSKKSDLKKNIYTFFDEKKIIEETKHIAESYFKKSRKILKKLNHINSDELFMFVDLLENRSF